MKKIIISVGVLLIIVITFLGITLNSPPGDTTFELNKIEDKYRFRIHNELDTKYFNQKVTINTNLYLKGNELFVEKDTYNLSDKISNIMFIESYDKSVILDESLCITSIDDEKNQINILAQFSLQYPYPLYKKREFFTIKYKFEYKIDKNEITLKMIDEKENSEF